jgi:hypothetical protein
MPTLPIDTSPLFGGKSNLSNVALTVSPLGAFNGGSSFNNGADYGPDTPGTTTCGIQEALNSLPGFTFHDGGLNIVPSKRGSVQLLGGVFKVTSVITIPSGVIRLRGAGQSNITPGSGLWPVFDDHGGTAIVGTSACTAAGVLRAPPSAFGYPSSGLDVGDFDVRIQSPVALQGTTGPAVCSFTGFMTGTISNIQAMELTDTGSFGGKMGCIMDMNAGAGVDSGTVDNICCYGGHTGFKCNRAHTFCTNVLAGFNFPLNNAFNHGFEIQQNTNMWFGNLHAFNTTYGIQAYSYPGGTFTIHGIHFESVAHYFLGLYNSGVSTIVFEEPLWEGDCPNPTTDIAAMLLQGGNTYNYTTKAGFVVMSRDEVDVANQFGGQAHVKVPNASLVAAASPYSFPTRPFDAVYVCTAVGGMNALTLNGVPVSIAAGIPIFVKAQSSLIATWTTTAPTFSVCPT